MPIEIYGQGKNKRDWLFVDDHVNALIKVMKNGEPGNIYTIGTGKDFTNIEIVNKIVKNLKNKLFLKKYGKFESSLLFVKDRPGHDFRYSIDASKINQKLDGNLLQTLIMGLLKLLIGIFQIQNGFQIKLIRNIKLEELEIKFSYEGNNFSWRKWY